MDNNNYVSVDLTSISLSVTYRKVQVAGPDPFYRFKSTTVDIRSSTNVSIRSKKLGVLLRLNFKKYRGNLKMV